MPTPPELFDIYQYLLFFLIAAKFHTGIACGTCQQSFIMQCSMKSTKSQHIDAQGCVLIFCVATYMYNRFQTEKPYSFDPFVAIFYEDLIVVGFVNIVI